MEAAPGHDPALRVSLLALLREPLLLAAVVAFVGGAVGLVGTFRQAAVEVAYAYDPYSALYAQTMQAVGETLAAFSLLGVPWLLGGLSRTAGRAAAYAGSVSLLLLLATSATLLFYGWSWTVGEEPSMGEPIPRLADVSFWTSLFLPPAVALPLRSHSPGAPQGAARGAARGAVPPLLPLRRRLVLSVP